MKKKVFSTGISVISALSIAQAEPTDTSDRQIGEVVVTGSRYETSPLLQTLTVSTVSHEQLEGSGRINALPTLSELVPGLFVTQRGVYGFGVSTGGSGGISVRGLSSSTGQVLVVIDGQPQYQGIYGHSISDSYMDGMVERIEIVRGPASVIYGSNAMGGVINIVTKRKLQQDGSQTNISLSAGSYGTVTATAHNSIRHGGFSSYVAAHYGRSDNHRPRMGFEQYGADLKLGYAFSDNWEAAVNADVTHFNASNPGATSAPMLELDQYITRGITSAMVSNRFEKASGRLSVYCNFGRHKINDGYAEKDGAPQKRLFRSKDALTGVSAYETFTFFEGNKTTFGFDYQNIYGRAYYTSRETGDVLETQNKQSGRVKNDEIAGYFDFNQTIADILTVDAGLRVDNHSVSGTQVMPQIGVTFRPTGEGALKAMVSKGFRNPTMREMYLYPPSNTDLEAESMMNYELSWHHSIKRVSYGVNVFYLDADNLIQTVNKKNVNTGEVKNAGAEMEVAVDLPLSEAASLRISTNHSILHMDTHIVGAPEYKGYLGVSSRIAPQGSKTAWDFGLSLTQVNDLFSAVGANESRENFSLLSANASCELSKRITFWVKGENLLAQEYEINKGYPMPKATAVGGIRLKF